MATRFPSDEWFEELKERLNDDETYAEQAAGWGTDFDGDFIFTIDPADGLEETVHYYIGLYDGECTEVYEVDNPAAADYGYQMSGDYNAWQKLAEDELGAIEGIMSGAFELDGSMNTLLKYQDAATTLVGTCGDIDTEYV